MMLGRRICTRRGYRLSLPKRSWKGKNYFSVIHEPVFERVDVPCGVSTPITIKIHNPSPSTPLPILLHITTSPPFSPPPPTPLPLLSPSHTTIHILPPPSPFPQPLHKLLYAYTHILSLLRPPQTRRYAQPPLRYPPIAIYGSSGSGGAGSTGGSLATALALTESLTAQGHGRYPSALITTNAIFDFSPLAIASLHPSHGAGISSLAGSTLKIRGLFANPPSTLDPLASPLLLFRGAGFHGSAFGGEWEPTPSPPPSLTAPDWEGWTDAPSDLDMMATSAPAPSPPRPETDANDAVAAAVADFDPTYPQKRSYLKFPPAHSGLRLPACNFQISHPLPPPPSKPTKASKSTKSKSAPPPPPGLDEPLEVVQAQLMASAINRSVRMGYDNPVRRGGEDGGEEERAVVSELGGEGEGDVEERGAVGAREWLRDTMDWR